MCRRHDNNNTSINKDDLCTLVGAHPASQPEACFANPGKRIYGLSHIWDDMHIWYLVVHETIYHINQTSIVAYRFEYIFDDF